MSALRVSANRRYFLTSDDNQPFFWLADTCWEMLARMTRAEIVQYLDNRQAKGFNVIQIVALTELSTDVANMEGNKALVSLDPTQPNAAYFDLLTFVIEQAKLRGIYVALLPTWGDKVETALGDIGPVIFNTTNAVTYGQYIGTLCAAHKNIIWVLGGDRFADDAPVRDIWRAMASGIETGYGAGAIMTYHPRGGGWSSAKYFKTGADGWCDIDMIQSGHTNRDRTQAWGLVATCQGVSPLRPVIDGEPNYEHHPVMNDRAFRFTEYDVRKQAYRHVFAGGAGVSYGHHSIWQVYAPGRTAITQTIPPSTFKYWYDALDDTGAAQLQHLKALMLTITPYLTRVADQSLMINPPDGSDPSIYMVAARGSSGEYGLVYTPINQTITVDFSKLSPSTIRARWFDPRTGAYQAIADHANSGQQVAFTPPISGGDDWVLVLTGAA